LGKFTSALSLEGVIDAKSSTIATSKVPAVVSEVLVSEGQNVKKGQVLARLEQSSLLKSRLELEQQLNFAKTLYEKQMRLWKNGIGTEVQYLSAKNQKEALEKSLNTLDANIDMYNIKSPIDGSIEAVDIKIGQTAGPGMPNFKVINMSSVKVVAQVSESYSGKINKGDKVVVSLPDLGKEISGTVSFASKFIDPALKPRETFCKVVIEPLYYTSDSINKEYPYMSMLLRSQPGLVLGSTLALVNIPTLLIRKKSLKFMTVTSTLFVMSAIGIVNVKWLKDH
jgi:RND family efflux transporter MFP subunit